MKYLITILLFALCSLAISQQTLRRGVGADIPEGAVLAFARTSCPEGFLEADGGQVSRTQFSKLFSVMGTIHGTGNGTTTFHKPDYRGRFLRGFDGSAGNDPDKLTRTAMNSGGAVGNAVGSVQMDAFMSHNHDTAQWFELGSDYGSISNASTPVIDATGSLTSSSHITSNAGGNENRPKNAYVIYCIKY